MKKSKFLEKEIPFENTIKNSFSSINTFSENENELINTLSVPINILTISFEY